MSTAARRWSERASLIGLPSPRTLDPVHPQPWLGRTEKKDATTVLHSRAVFRRSSRRVIGLAVPVLTLSLVLAGCGGDEPAATPSSSATPTDGSEPAPAPTEPVTWPLTGLKAKKPGDVTKNRILVVKVDNVAAAMPQAGLSGADLIVEELVEGGVTRLAAFYNSELPTEVGPIRSMRASDIGIVPTDSTIVTSGAAGVTISRMQSAKIPFISEGAKGVYRASGRFAPHNLMANLADISTTTRKPKERPADYLPWGTKADLPKGGKAVSLAASFGSRTTTWAYEKGGYRNTNTYAAADDQFIADSVLVLRVQTGDAGYLDPSGSYVPETKFEGEGQPSSSTAAA